MKSYKVTGFSMVFLYAEPIRGVDISTIKKALKLSPKEQVTLAELGDLGVGLISLDARKKRISLERNRITFVDADIRENQFNGLNKILKPTLKLLEKSSLKAYGFNYDVVIEQGKEVDWKRFFSSQINKMISSYKVGLFGIKLSLNKSKKQYNLEIVSADKDKKLLMVHFNDHNEATTIPTLKTLNIQAQKGLDNLTKLLAST